MQSKNNNFESVTIALKMDYAVSLKYQPKAKETDTSENILNNLQSKKTITDSYHYLCTEKHF